jgi:hypothetical protein
MGVSAPSSKIRIALQPLKRREDNGGSPAMPALAHVFFNETQLTYPAFSDWVDRQPTLGLSIPLQILRQLVNTHSTVLALQNKVIEKHKATASAWRGG